MGSKYGYGDDPDLQAAWKVCQGSPSAVAKFLKISSRNVFARRANLEKRGIYLRTVHAQGGHENTPWGVKAHAYTPRRNETIKDGYCVIFSDCHYWPQEVPLAHIALVKVCKQIQPKLIIANGDIFDGANISRHEPMGWQKLPTVIEELDTVKLRLSEIKNAAPRAKRLYTVGNHCSRFDRRLATEVAQFEDVPGMRLQDHLKDWPMSYSVLINEEVDPVFVLHNIRSGIHAPHNNAKAAGCTTVTGHLHAQKSQPVTTLMQDMEGIDAGCIADYDSPAFSYRMDRPSDWRSGFCLMRFDKNGRRFPVEFVRIQRLKTVHRATFRSEVIAERSI